jgi:hypothetical protein
MTKSLLIAAAGLVLFGCGLEENNFGTSKHESSTLAITNSEGESDVLRTGTSLSIAVPADLELKPNTVFDVVVSNISTGREVSRAALLSDALGQIELSTVAHDLGEFDDVGERHTLQVKVTHPDTGILAEKELSVTPHKPDLKGHGFAVDEVQPPHVYSADSSGKPVNAFVVGGAPEGQEVGPPIYVAGKGLPTNVTKVDVYVVKDGDVWQGKTLPQPGDASYVAGPVVADVQGGVLQATKISWQPTGPDVGVYDLLVDVDRNGTFDYTFSAKDGADGENKVGFTLQYGAAWFRTKMTMKSKHLLVNLAFSSKSRSGTWRNSYSNTENIYSYVNPPVQRGSKHGYVKKLLIEHQDWNQFWNNPDKLVKGGQGYGRISLSGKVVQGTGGTPQQGCTNSPPVKLVNPGNIPANNNANNNAGNNNNNGGDGTKQTQSNRRFDVVFDYGKDGYYDIGVDFLDVVSTRTDGALLTSKDLEGLSSDQIYGLELKY